MQLSHQVSEREYVSWKLYHHTKKAFLWKGGEQKNNIRQNSISWICLAMHLWFLWRRGENTFDILTCLSLSFQGHLVFCPSFLTYDLVQSSEKFHWFSISFMKSGLFPRHADDTGQELWKALCASCHFYGQFLFSKLLHSKYRSFKISQRVASELGCDRISKNTRSVRICSQSTDTLPVP